MLKVTWLVSATLNLTLTVGRTSKVKPPPWYKSWVAGVDGTLPWVFAVFQYFRKILPLIESALQDEVYFMGGGAGGGL